MREATPNHLPPALPFRTLFFLAVVATPPPSTTPSASAKALLDVHCFPCSPIHTARCPAADHIRLRRRPLSFRFFTRPPAFSYDTSYHHLSQALRQTSGHALAHPPRTPPLQKAFCCCYCIKGPHPRRPEIAASPPQRERRAPLQIRPILPPIDHLISSHARREIHRSPQSLACQHPIRKDTP